MEQTATLSTAYRGLKVGYVIEPVSDTSASGFLCGEAGKHKLPRPTETSAHLNNLTEHQCQVYWLQILH